MPLSTQKAKDVCRSINNNVKWQVDPQALLTIECPSNSNPFIAVLLLLKWQMIIALVTPLLSHQSPSTPIQFILHMDFLLQWDKILTVSNYTKLEAIWNSVKPGLSKNNKNPTHRGWKLINFEEYPGEFN